MAEGIQLTPMSTMFYCYRCDQEVSILSTAELTCPECFGGFLEEVPQDDYEDESDVDESDLNMFNMFEMGHLFSRAVGSYSGEEESQRNSPEEPEEEDDADSSTERSPMPLGEFYDAHRFLQELEEQLIQGPNSRLSHIGDYLFGDDIDALSTLLFNEAEVLGPPPLPASKIRLLPVITVSQQHVEKGIQCTICMEDFAVRDRAKNLPCDHFYHEKCITPWLEKHATCPNCRKTVEVSEKSSKSPKNRRSQSCPRSFSRSSSMIVGSRQMRERPSLGALFNGSLNPFRLF